MLGVNTYYSHRCNGHFVMGTLAEIQILGTYNIDGFNDAVFKVSAHCNRVPVTDGHTECVSVKVNVLPMSYLTLF